MYNCTIDGNDKDNAVKATTYSVVFCKSSFLKLGYFNIIVSSLIFLASPLAC